MLMEREKLFKVLTALELSITDAEAYVAHRLNTPVPTPLTLIYFKDGKFIYENQYDPNYKNCFIGFYVESTVFYAGLFKCSNLRKGWQLNKVTGLELRQMCHIDYFPQTAYLATSREKNIVYGHKKEWDETVRILAERHLKMYPVKKIGGNLFNNIDRGGLQIYCAATNEYYDCDTWLENGTMMICSGKI